MKPIVFSLSMLRDGFHFVLPILQPVARKRRSESGAETVAKSGAATPVRLMGRQLARPLQLYSFDNLVIMERRHAPDLVTEHRTAEQQDLTVIIKMND